MRVRCHRLRRMWLVMSSLAVAGTQAYVGARLHPVAAPPIDDGVLVVTDGRIAAVGGPDTPVPPGAEVVRLDDRVVIPGLVDTHTHLGGGGLNEMSGPIQPALSAVDTIDVTHESLGFARAGGITTANVMPGSGNLVGGQTVYVKLRHADTIDEMLFCESRRGICGGMKMANGTNPQGSGAYPRTRMGAAAKLRQAFADVLKERPRPSDDDRKKKRRRRKRKKNAPGPLSDHGAEALRQVLHGERTVHFHTHRADDVQTILELRDEYDLDVVLHHVSEAWKVADVIARAEVPCSLILIDSPGGKEEAVEFRAENAALLEQRGVSVSLHTDAAITDSRLFLRSAGLAVRAGMTPEGALEALTLAPAAQLGLDDRVGSLEVGKDADFVVLSGEPLSVWTHVQQTYVDGAIVFDRDRPADLRLAEGGFAVPERVPEIDAEVP